MNIDSADIGSMLESVVVERINSPVDSRYCIRWTDLTGYLWSVDQLIEHTKIEQFHQAQQSFDRSDDGSLGLDVTFMLQPIFTERSPVGRICAMAYLKIDSEGDVVARIKRIPITGDFDEPFECPGGTPTEAPDVYPLPIRDR